MPPLPPSFEARLVHARPLTPSVRELVFERLDGQPMAFVPGQWVSAFCMTEAAAGEGPATGAPATATIEVETKRSYSIASAPDGSARFELAITRVHDGPMSTRLHAMEPGTVLRFTGPQGFFTRAPEASAAPALMIATGTGVTPMRSMLRAAVMQPSPGAVCLLLGVRHEEDLLYEDELRAAARDHGFLRFEPTLSQPRGPWGGRRGYVQTHVRALWDELVARGEGPPHAYVCGLERMVGSVRDLLRKEMGIPRQQVHGERYD
jgi:ferredoxin-NADP reductase